MKLERPFIRLPYSFDVGRLQQELKEHDTSTWMPHPSGMKGNSALPLIAKDGKDNNEFDGAMCATPHLQKCPYMQQLMAHIGEVYGRSRLMKLSSGTEVSRHVDFNYHWYQRVRIHVPIVTSPDVIFYCGDQAINMHAGECWIFDSWRHHKVVNNGDKDRVHLVFDTAGSSRFWQQVRQQLAVTDRLINNGTRDRTKLGEKAAAPNPQTGNSNGTRESTAFPTLQFDPSAIAQIKTERYNSAPVMSPGELQALAEDLLADLEANASNDAALLTTYRNLLEDLAKDWREIWHLHGMQQSGWRHYKHLLDRTVGQLESDPRALTTASNDLGANPIIMQRILRAALRVDLNKDFFSN